MKLEISRQIFETFPNIKFRENPSSGSLVFPCGRMDEQGDMTKLIVAFRDFAKAPKKRKIVDLMDLFSWQFFPEYLLKIVNTIFFRTLYIYFVRFGNNSLKRSPYSPADQL
jgi:hypothetical protein